MSIVPPLNHQGQSVASGAGEEARATRSGFLHLSGSCVLLVGNGT